MEVKIITKDDLRVTAKESLKKISSYRGDIKEYNIMSTSGTTGEPLTMCGKWHYPSLITKYDNNNKEVVNSVIVLAGPIGLRLFHALFFLNRKEEDSDSTILAFDNLDLNENVDSILKDFKPDFLYTSSPFLFKWMVYIQNKELVNSVHGISRGSEFLTAAKEEMLRDKFQNANIASLYVSIETGPLAVSECPYLKRNHYHPYEGVVIEINNIDEKGVGDIIVSSEIAPMGPLNKYAIGDLGRLEQEACRCGEKTTLEIIGRAGYDYIKIAGAAVHREEVERVIKELKEYIVDFEMEVHEKVVNKEVKGFIKLKILPTQKLSKKEESISFICDKFSTMLFLTPSQTLDDLVKKGIFLNTEVEFVKKISSDKYKKTPITYIQDSK